VALSSVRQLFRQEGFGEDNSIVRNGCAYKLSLSAGSFVDVSRFEYHVREAATRRANGDMPGSLDARRAALGLYRGDLLPEDGPAEHVIGERERLRMLAAVTAASLAEDHCGLGDRREALAAAWQSVRIDPYQDLPWRLIIRLSESIGDSSAAQVARRQHARARAKLGL
jgi:two-component SAPR family response regulator